MYPTIQQVERRIEEGKQCLVEEKQRLEQLARDKEQEMELQRKEFEVFQAQVEETLFAKEAEAAETVRGLERRTSELDKREESLNAKGKMLDMSR